MSREQPKRLGRGLAALLGESAPLRSQGSASDEGPTDSVQSLGIELLEPSPFQPRKRLLQEALDELAASIARQGVLQPLLVRPHPAKPGHYQIIAGERRWRAAQQAQLHEVPVLIRPLSDAAAVVAALVENLQRADLNPLEEAMGYRRLMDEFGMTQEALAETIGKSRAHVGNSLRILSLPENVLALVRDGQLSFGHARALVTHSDPGPLAERVAREQLSVRETERLAAARAAPPPAQRERSEGDSETEALARGLSEKLGLHVKVTFNGQSGAVIIGYRTLDQLDEIVALLNT